MTASPSIPTVLTLSGHDPSGGAGVQADIESIISHGCHACTLVTALTIQDTRNVKTVQVIDPNWVLQQADLLLADISVQAIKIGLIGSAAMIDTIEQILARVPKVPVVLDPILAAGGGTSLATERLMEALNQRLLPHTTVLTPNIREALALTQQQSAGLAAKALNQAGCEYVLMTGADEAETEVYNSLYHNGSEIEHYTWKLLPSVYHGSGCTLASSIAALLAQGNSPLQACHEAQHYAWETLSHGYRIGHGQSIPNRLYWTQD